MTRYDALLNQNQERALSEVEQLELLSLRQEAEQFMLCKAHAAFIVKWRGYQGSMAMALGCNQLHPTKVARE